MSMNYQEVLDFLYTQLPMYQKIGKAAFNKGLGKTQALLEALGNPHQNLKFIHVAGTNGKGSVTHMLASILQHAGYKTGIYTSPHLKSFKERIKINGLEIEEQFVAGFVTENKQLITQLEPSFFEITVAICFSYFQQKKVDLSVIEVGLGGRLDSTNVIDPLLSIITSIGMDHQDILGHTIEEIAREKGGIIKRNIPVVVGDLPIAALTEIERLAKEKEAPFYQSIPLAAHTYSSDLKGKPFELNLSTVKTAVDVLIHQGIKINEENIQNGLKAVCQVTGFKGRWQILNTAPYTVCDIGHNVEAITSIIEQINDMHYESLHMVIGMSADKSVADVLNLMPKSANYYFCAADVSRALTSEKLRDLAFEVGLSGTSYDSVKEAIAVAKKHANEDDLIFIGGSAFIVAEIEEL